MKRSSYRLLLALSLATPSPAVAVSVVTEYPVPSGLSRPTGIGEGNGVLWFTEFDANKIASIDSRGVITEISLPTPDSGPEAVAPYGYGLGVLAFTEFKAGKIGQISADGKLTEFALPNPNAGPRGIAWQYNSILYFTEYNADKIGSISFDGTLFEGPLAPGSRPLGIIAGPSRNCCESHMWFTEFGTNKIGRFGYRVFQEYVLPTPNSGPTGITTGGVGSLAGVFFTEFNANKIGMITADGTIQEFAIPTPDSGPLGISAGDNGVWFTESRANKLGRLNADGTITEFPIPTPNAGLSALSGTWFVESNGNRIGRLSPDWLVAVGSGKAGAWDTELDLANPGAKTVTATIGPPPPRICGICMDPDLRQDIPGHGARRVSASDVPIGYEHFDTFRVTTALTPDDDLPVARARIVNRSRPSQSAEIPVVRLSTLRKLNPSVLTFPGASRGGTGAHSNLVLAEVSEQGEPLEVLVEAFSADGETVGNGRSVSLSESQTTLLVDVLGLLGVSDLAGGQIRVTKTGGTGLLWGLLATVSDDGTLSTSPGMNP